jgi:acyl-CoA dehydrogenase
VDFARSEEQDEIAGLAARILTDLVTVDRLRAVEDDDGDGGGASGDRFDREVWSALADAGLLGVALPTDLGGSGLGLVEQCLVLEQVGRTVAPVPVLASCVLGALPIATYGSEALRTRWVPPTISGEAVLTAALVEPANRQPEHPTTVATPDGDGWRLTGVKTCVPAGTVAAAIVVSATIDGGGAGLFLVEPGAEGLTIEGQRVTNRDLEAQLTLDGVTAELVTDDAAALPWLLERATVGLCAQAAGVVGRALELTAAYAKERVQFGRPIATFQAVGQRAADAYIDVEATRLVLWQAAWRLSEGLPAATEVQVAKYWAAEAAHRVGHTAVHIHGGTGVDVDHPIHRYLIASRELELTLGGATDQLLRIGATLAASPG